MDNKNSRIKCTTCENKDAENNKCKCNRDEYGKAESSKCDDYLIHDKLVNF